MEWPNVSSAMAAMKIGALLATALISVAAAVLCLVFGKWSPDKGCLTNSAYWKMRQAVVGMSGSEVISKLGEPASSKYFPLWIWLPEDPERRVPRGTPPQDIID